MNRVIILVLALIAGGCKASTLKLKQVPEKKVIITNHNGKGPEISLELVKGESFYYPLTLSLRFWK